MNFVYFKMKLYLTLILLIIMVKIHAQSPQQKQNLPIKNIHIPQVPLFIDSLKVEIVDNALKNGYRGEINLILSNVKENSLTIDSNGIGYINEWTFNKTYSRPIVEQVDGRNLDENLIMQTKNILIYDAI